MSNTTSRGHETVLLLAAVALGVFWAIQTTNYAAVQPRNVALVFAGFLVGWAVVRRARGASWATLVYTVIIGIADRLPRTPIDESDVMKATEETIGVLSRGQNPYAHFFQTTIPPGSPFPYPPGEIFFYAIPRAIFGQIFEVDKWTGIAIVLLLAFLAVCVGPARAAIATALYGTFGFAAFLSLDGSNDTSVAFLIVLAIVLLALSERGQRGARVAFYASAAAFAWALAFKEFSWLLYPFVLTHLYRRRDPWLRYAVVSVVPAAIITLYFFALSPADFLHNVAGEVTVHQGVSGLNLWSGLLPIAPNLLDTLRPSLPVIGLIAGAAIAVPLLLRPAAALSTAIFQGLAVTFIALFFPRWTASAYYAGASALVAAGVALAGWVPGEGTGQDDASPGDASPPGQHSNSIGEGMNGRADVSRRPTWVPIVQYATDLVSITLRDWRSRMTTANAGRVLGRAAGAARTIAALLGGRRDRTPILCAAAALAIACLALIPTLGTAGGRTSVLVHIADNEPMAKVARAADPDFALVPAQAHSDGVHFYAIALDPFGFGAPHTMIDDGVYRYGHPGYGWLVGVLSLGQAAFLPTVMLTVNLALFALAAFLVSEIARGLGRSPWWGMIVAFNPGFIYAVTDDTTEPALMAVTALGLLLWLRRRRLAIVVLAAGCFIKEAGLLVPVGIALFEGAELLREKRILGLLRAEERQELLAAVIESPHLRRIATLEARPGIGHFEAGN